jgi:hypothetical protein
MHWKRRSGDEALFACRNIDHKARRALSPLEGESWRGGSGRSGDRSLDEGPKDLLRNAHRFAPRTPL